METQVFGSTCCRCLKTSSPCQEQRGSEWHFYTAHGRPERRLSHRAVELLVWLSELRLSHSRNVASKTRVWLLLTQDRILCLFPQRWQGNCVPDRTVTLRKGGPLQHGLSTKVWADGFCCPVRVYSVPKINILRCHKRHISVCLIVLYLK